MDKAAVPTDADVARYADFGKLVYNYERMTKPLFKRPLYKDPKTLLVLIVLLLVAYLVSEVM